MKQRTLRIRSLITAATAIVIVTSTMTACSVRSTGVDRTFGKKQKKVSQTAVFHEATMVVRIMGRPLGYAYESTEIGPGGSRASMHMDISLSRMGQSLNIVASGNFHDGPDGRTISSTFSYKASAMTVTSKAEMIDNSIRYTSGAEGYEKTRWILWEDGALGAATAGVYTEELLRAGKKEFTYRIFDVESGEFKTHRVVRVDADPIEIDGRLQTPIVFEQYEGDDEKPMQTTWLDEEFVHYKTSMVQMGIDFVLERVTEEELAEMEFEPDFDLLAETGIECDGYPEDLGTLEDVTLRLHFEQMPSERQDFMGPNQTVVGRGDGYIDLLVTRKVVNEIEMARDDRKSGVFLDPDRYIQSTDERIRAVADSVRTASGLDGWELAQELSMWVNAYITGKNYGQGFASAIEVFESRAGDCTEHTVLLTALLRAADIPARPAVGVVYQKGYFYGHMWAEAYDGYWRSLDALDPRMTPIRIRVAGSKDEQAFDGSDLVRAYDMVGGMSVKVLKYNLIAED